MEQIWALIKNGVVVNTIVADQKFIDHLMTTPKAPDSCVRIDELPNIEKPTIGSKHDGQKFKDHPHHRKIAVAE